MIEFGEKEISKEYRERLGAYAVIRNEKNELALAEVHGKYFLPGGGIDGTETPEQTTIREAMEEIGAKIRIIRKIGTAGEYLHLRGKNEYWHKTGIFFEASIIELIGTGIESDHILVWRTVEQALPNMRQLSHAWAIKQATPQ